MLKDGSGGNSQDAKMKTNIGNLIPKHGQELIIDCDNAKTKDALKRLSQCQREASIYLLAVFVTIDKDNKMTVPCKQCFLDTALQFEEIGSLIRELCDDK